MVSFRQHKTVPYSAEQMYALVNDVESYPQFIHWCEQVNVLERNDEQVTAELGFTFGPVRNAFTTKNTLTPSQKIEVELVAGPFKHLHGVWNFKQTPKGCVVTFAIEFTFASRLFSLTLGPVFKPAVATLMDAFIARADKVLR